jgi:hypothetical protein
MNRPSSAAGGQKARFIAADMNHRIAIDEAAKDGQPEAANFREALAGSL